jgi:hypothetical protein
MRKRFLLRGLILLFIILVFTAGLAAALQLNPELRKNLEFPINRNQPTATPTAIEEKDLLDGVVIAVSGYVISGGDTTPEGLLDTPRKFVFKVKEDSSFFVNVSYTAYPPSPVGDREMEKIRLNFHAGTIKIGDYLVARGVYDKKTDMVIVANQGDYIETYLEKP